ncbi:hypothetical protein J7E70_00190 [Variovorax paradoxus]|nr:hypothetical protein [Variovorax paradoxus]MBT2298871.1 hypothetical protein [Variovorax paradoxus]
MNPYEIEEVASRVVKLSLDAMSENSIERADELMRIAASLELISPELQNCWGGPLNGQEGRRAIFRELISTVGFDAVFETGTYRGLTTAWFADHFSGPIYSCEIDKRYHYQAQSNLRARGNIHLSLEDSRQFLRRSLAASPERGRYFVYLDAHWHDDLPLAEEIQIILESARDCVIAIDDFKVPEDDYKFDDYGPGKVISLELLEQFKDESIRFFFPKLPASSETGAARGVCVITRELAAEVENCGLLEGNSWAQWRNVEAAHDASRHVALTSAEAEDSGAYSQDKPRPALERSNPISSELGDMNTVKSGIASLLESQSSLYKLVENYARLLNERLESIDDRREMGRSLVEQKAKNLELERQNYRLTEELHNLVHKTATPSAMSEILHIRNLVEGLLRSRMINSVSTIAPKARQTVEQIAGRLDQLIRDL